MRTPAQPSKNMSVKQSEGSLKIPSHEHRNHYLLAMTSRLVENHTSHAPRTRTT